LILLIGVSRTIRVIEGACLQSFSIHNGEFVVHDSFLFTHAEEGNLEEVFRLSIELYPMSKAVKQENKQDVQNSA